MKKAVLFFMIGVAVTYAAVSLQLDIFVVLAGVCSIAGAITYGYLLLMKRQYDRMGLADAESGASRHASTRPAA